MKTYTLSRKDIDRGKKNSSVGGEERQQDERKVIDKEVGCIGSKVSKKIRNFNLGVRRDSKLCQNPARLHLRNRLKPLSTKNPSFIKLLPIMPSKASISAASSLSLFLSPSQLHKRPYLQSAGQSKYFSSLLTNCCRKHCIQFVGLSPSGK